MKNKWFISAVLLIFTVLIICIGGVSAADNSTVSNMSSDIADSGNLDTSSNSGNSILGDSSNGTSIKSDVHVSTDDGFELQNEISNSNNTIIYLDNQTFILNSTSNYGLCIDSNKNLTICGGYSIGDGKTSTLSAEKLDEIPTLLINSNSTVTLININFINNNNEYIYALRNKGKLVLINCTFNNNTKSLKSTDDTVLINCTFIKNSKYNLAEIEVGCDLFEMQNCTLINMNCHFNSVDESIINNSNFRNSSINPYHPLNSTINNSVFDGGSDSAIFIFWGRSVFVVDNCTFSNINLSENSAAIKSLNSCINITNSKFINNSALSTYGSGSAIFSDNGGMVYLENCSFDNNSASYYGGACYFDTNATLKNCSFNNNSGLVGGSIYSGYYLNSTNCSYDGNSAVYGGAIYGYKSTVLINDSSFKDNYALMAGGAVSSYLSSTVVNNSIFTNNSANVCGGAVVIGNSTLSVSNSNFTLNDGEDYGNDIYCYGSNLTLNDNSISSVYNVSNDTLVTSFNVSDSSCVVYLDNNTTGFCLEENFLYPTNSYGNIISFDWYTVFNHTNLALNSLNYQKVGDYIKYVIINYYGKVPDFVLDYVIWIFTDNNYTNPVTGDTISNIYQISTVTKYHYGAIAIPNILSSTLLGDNYNLNHTQFVALVSEIVNDAISAYNSGVRIPDHYVEVDENGTGTLYDFGSIFSNFYQNFITFKTSNYTVVYDMNVTKITNNPVVYKGEDTSFDIVVSNNGTMTLNNVSIIEDSYDDLTYKSWTSTDNWTYSFVNNKHTWTLNNPLSVNQSARITVIFSTNNSTVGDKINTVIATSNNTDNKTANNTTEVIENNTTNPNNPENNTPNKPTPASPDNHSNITPKEAVKTTPDTGYPIIVLIIALITILASRVRKK